MTHRDGARMRPRDHRTRRGVRRLGVLVPAFAALVLVQPGPPTVSATPPGTGGPAAGCAAVTTSAAGVWTTRTAPRFPSGAPLLSAYAVDPADRGNALVSNGTVVLRTTDGCTWDEVWRVPDGATARVADLVWHPRAPGHAWATVVDAPDASAAYPPGFPANPFGPSSETDRNAVHGHLVHSDDGGVTWRDGSTLSHPTGRFVPSPTDPSVGFWPTDTALQRTDDGGRTWLPLPLPVTAREGEVNVPVVRVVAADAVTPGLLRATAGYPVRSPDGGLTWERDGTETGHWSGPFLDGGEAGRSRLLTTTATYASSPVTRIRTEGVGPGVTDTEITRGTIKGQAWSAAWSPIANEALLATWDAGSPSNHPDVSVYRVDVADDGRARVEDVNDLGLGQVGGVGVDRGGVFHLFTDSALHTLSPAGSIPPYTGDDPGGISLAPFPPSTPPPPSPARIEAPAVVDVAPGGTATVDLALDLPRRPGALDVYFLLDTSNSFEPDLQEIASGLADVVRTLTRRGIDAHYGLGELGTSDNGRRYRRWADIAAPGRPLQQGFEQLRTGGGNEAHLIALGQVATGSGVPGTTGPTVDPGQDPSWRRDALRLMVTVTDVRFSDEGDPDAPTRQQVYDGLAADDVRAVGLEIVRELGDDRTPGGPAAVEAADRAGTTVPTPARADLEELAAATGATAPRGGVDCSGNGTVEIPAGAPMVCTATAVRTAGLSSLGEVLPRLLLAQEDPATVTLDAAGEASWAWRSPAAGRVEDLDLRLDQRIPATATVGCSTAQEGTTLPVRLAATVAPLRTSPQQVATTTLLVRCGTPEDAPPPGPERQPEQLGPPTGTPGSPPAQAPGAVPPPGPPPVPVNAPGTAPGTAQGTAPGTAPGSATGAAPAPGTAGSEVAAHRGQQAEQTLLATLDGLDSGQHEDRTPATAPLLGAAALAAGVAGLVARRRQTPTARASSPARPTQRGLR